MCKISAQTIKRLPSVEEEFSTPAFSEQDEAALQERIELAHVDVLSDVELAIDGFANALLVFVLNTTVHEKQEFANTPFTNPGQLILHMP